MLKVSLVVLFFFTEAFCSYCQPVYKYWIGFTDKLHNSYSVNEPEQYLSQRAIERRNKQGIRYDINDLPVTKQYIDSIKNMGIQVLYASKWLNGITISVSDSNGINPLKIIQFIKEIKLTYLTKPKTPSLPSSSSMKLLQVNACQFDASKKQLEIMNGQCLHNMGYCGQGILIAVLDGGFSKVNKLRTFDSLWFHNQIIGHRDFVNAQRNFFDTHSHGMEVLSIMGGNVPDTLVGTAPMANYLLVITEDTESENPVEEYNWCAGAEYADSLGVDVINTSLGYTTFDDKTMNHSYNNFNGEITPCARGVKIAASKGMIVVVSAGNEGGLPWKYLTTPGDAKYCLTVGAVDSLKRYATFSSLGPTSEGRIKPDICTMGSAAIAQMWNGTISRGSGTSFSSPLAAGMVACLWQAFPNRSNFEIMDAIIESSNKFSSPNDTLGYGIPDFDKAFSILNQHQKTVDQPKNLTLSPNPFTKKLKVSFNSIIEQPFVIEFFDINGKRLYHSVVEPIFRSSYDFFNVDTLPKGLLVGRIIFQGKNYNINITKDD